MCDESSSSSSVGSSSSSSSSNMSRQLKTVERSIIFLRQEHLTLLHGLHLEILSLQKRCSELTGELEVMPAGKSQIDLQDEESLLQLRRQEAEKRLAERDCTLGELRTELSHKGALVGALRANLKEKERHFLEELKRRSHCSTVLNTELQQQTEAAAYLSFQLHAARQKLHQQRMQQRQQLLLGRGQGAQYGAERNPASPHAASAASPSSPVVKPKRRSARAASRAERARECVPTERVLGPAEPTAMPDPALFLHPRRHRPCARQRREGEGGGAGPEEAPPAAETQADF